jgi:glycosidase
MVVSALISTSPTLIYFGQELGEPGAETGGFGQPTRTSIFDYVGVPHHQRWMNKGKFDGGQSREQERKLRSFYQELLQFTISQPVLKGNYAAIQYHNRQHTPGYHDKLFAFSRWDMDSKLVVLNNFSNQPYEGKLVIPADLVQKWALKDGTYSMNQVLFGKNQIPLTVSKGEGSINVQVPTYESLVLRLKK